MSSQSVKPSVMLIKLGGAIITDKSIPNTLRPEVLKRLVTEIKHAQAEMDDFLVVGHGAGSFAHVPAAHYDTINGFKDEHSQLGMAIVQDSAAQLNRLVVKEFLQQGIPAVSACASSSIVTKNKELHSYYTDVFETYLKNGLVPVTYGDVIVDEAIGCTIWSTDVILSYIAREFLQHGWHINRVIHVTQVAGVYKDLKHPEKGMFDVITPENAEEVKKSMGVTKGFDVTGGMWKKIEESLIMSSQGLETLIISGEKPDLLYRALTGQEVTGTLIRS